MIATSVGIFLARAFVIPAFDRYAAWRDDPRREKVARPNWRGIYVPDLRIIRMQRIAWGTLAVVVALSLAMAYTVPTTPLPNERVSPPLDPNQPPPIVQTSSAGS